MDIRIGDLRHRLTLEMVVRADDGCGGAEENWVAIGEMWGAPLELNAFIEDFKAVAREHHEDLS